MNANLRHDLDHLVSWVLLGLALAAIGTGIIADVWDLNSYRWHRWAGYGLAVGAFAHVAFTWRRLVAYTRFRARQLRHANDHEAHHPVPARPHAPSASSMSRRGVLAALFGGGVGLLLGRGLRQPPAIPGGEDLGFVYHQWSKPGLLTTVAAVLEWGGRPAMRKTYPDAPRHRLPTPEIADGPPTGEAIQARRSIRSYGREPLSEVQLSGLLALADGLRPGKDDRRTAPSAGALFPIEVYPVVHRVDGVDPGVYHYDPFAHELSLLDRGDKRRSVVGSGFNQDFLGGAGVTLYLTLVFQRVRFRYKDRAYRYGMLEAGHIGQNVYLAAASMGLGTCAVGAFHDDQVNDLLGVDGQEEAAVYLLSVGTRG